MLKQRHLESQVTDPDSPTSPKMRAGSLMSPTVLPNIATSKSGNRSSIGAIAADYVSPNKTTQGGVFQFATNPNNTVNGPNAARMAATGTGFYDKQKQDAQAERLIHSVNAVTDLLKANTELRDNLERVERDREGKDGENMQLSVENQQLRERVELMEGIMRSNNDQLE